MTKYWKTTMAKTKHQKLADLMQTMLDAIEDHKTKVAKHLECVQLHFYERYALIGRPLIKKSAFHSMCFSHYIGLKNFAPDSNTKAACQEFPMLGVLLERSTYLASECRQSSGEGIWFIPWGARIVLPRDNQDKLERNCAQALLFCPLEDEISNEIDWFKQETAADSLSHQLLSVFEYERQQTIVKQNLLKDPYPIWEEAKKVWQDTERLTSDAPNIFYDVAKNPQRVDEVDFAPQEKQSLAFAYEAVLQSIRTRSYRHRQALLSVYKSALEQALFEQVPWNKEKQKAFLNEWRDNLFKENSKLCSSKPGRWSQCKGISDFKAARLIKYFLEKFIANPQDKKMGEVACLLWILIWIAHEPAFENFTIQKVLQLSSQDIDPEDAVIVIDSKNIDISWGLRDLLLCLRGKGAGKQRFKATAQLNR